jgi:hypothetical protein
MNASYDPNRNMQFADLYIGHLSFRGAGRGNEPHKQYLTRGPILDCVLGSRLAKLDVNIGAQAFPLGRWPRPVDAQRVPI